MIDTLTQLFIAEEITHTTAGLIGEHIAAAAILQRGWSCSMTQQDGYDLIAAKGRHIFRIQVKSGTLTSRRPKKSSKAQALQFTVGIGRNKRAPTTEDFDILCMVSSETRACLFVPVMEIKQRKYCPRVGNMTPEKECESWNQSVEVMGKMLA